MLKKLTMRCSLVCGCLLVGSLQALGLPRELHSSTVLSTVPSEMTWKASVLPKPTLHSLCSKAEGWARTSLRYVPKTPSSLELIVRQAVLCRLWMDGMLGLELLDRQEIDEER